MSITGILEKKTNLSYEEAWTAMTFGHKVQLSDWSGYWFMESSPAPEITSGTNAKIILVFTRDGQILDTPFLERYKDRTDWQITDGKMGYDFAIRALKAGRKVAAEDWKDKWLALDSTQHKKVYSYDKVVEVAMKLSADKDPHEAVQEMLKKFADLGNEIYLGPAPEMMTYIGLGYILKFKKREDGAVIYAPYTPTHKEQIEDNWIVV